MPRSPFGIYADHQHEYAPPIVRQINAAQSTEVLPLTDMDAKTLAALEADPAVPAGLRSACKAELKGRDAGGATEGNSLAKSAAACAARSKGDALPALGMIGASHSSSKNALTKSVERRAALAANMRR